MYIFVFTDFENRFRFHNANELPPPEPFSNSSKTYPSTNPSKGPPSSTGELSYVCNVISHDQFAVRLGPR